MIKYSKYKPLADYLSKTGNDKITLTFSEIENILGFKLPKSARKHRAIWANDRSHSLSKGWLPVQYRSYSPDMKDEIVNFKKDNSLNPNTNGEQISKSNKSKIIKPLSTNVIVLTNELIEEGHRQVKATNNFCWKKEFHCLIDIRYIRKLYSVIKFNMLIQISTLTIFIQI